MLNWGLFFLPEGGTSVKTPAIVTKNENKPKNTEGLTRQQWKNKMKNKRNCKNKYRQNKPENEENKTESEDNHKPKQEVKTNLLSSNGSGKMSQTTAQKKKTQRECKPQKRKKAEETDTVCASEKQTLTEEKQPMLKVQKTEGATAKKGSKSVTDRCEAEAEITHDQQQVPIKGRKPELSKEQRLKREKLRKLLNSQTKEQQESPAEQKDSPAAPQQPAPVEEVKLDRSASLRSRMEQRLESARFRYINEVLYSTSSGEAKRMFKQDPQAFWIYHKGYTAQVQRWPANPVDTIISYIQKK